VKEKKSVYLILRHPVVIAMEECKITAGAEPKYVLKMSISL
jgi:hypothetical protein